MKKKIMNALIQIEYPDDPNICPKAITASFTGRQNVIKLKVIEVDTEKDLCKKDLERMKTPYISY
jgi:hypothetical protein